MGRNGPQAGREGGGAAGRERWTLSPAEAGRGALICACTFPAIGRTVTGCAAGRARFSTNSTIVARLTFAFESSSFVSLISCSRLLSRFLNAEVTTMQVISTTMVVAMLETTMMVARLESLRGALFDED